CGLFSSIGWSAFFDLLARSAGGSQVEDYFITGCHVKRLCASLYHVKYIGYLPYFFRGLEMILCLLRSAGSGQRAKMPMLRILLNLKHGARRLFQRFPNARRRVSHPCQSAATDAGEERRIA